MFEESRLGAGEQKKKLLVGISKLNFYFYLILFFFFEIEGEGLIPTTLKSVPVFKRGLRIVVVADNVRSKNGMGPS